MLFFYFVSRTRMPLLLLVLFSAYWPTELAARNAEETQLAAWAGGNACVLHCEQLSLDDKKDKVSWTPASVNYDTWAARCIAKPGCSSFVRRLVSAGVFRCFVPVSLVIKLVRTIQYGRDAADARCYRRYSVAAYLWWVRLYSTQCTCTVGLRVV